jgi:cytoskeletal protein RodZ
MKKKQLRLLAIVALIVVFLGAALARLKIEPATPAAPAETVSADGSELSATAEEETPDQSAAPASTPEEPQAVQTTEEAKPNQSTASEPSDTDKQTDTAVQSTDAAPPEVQPEVHTCTLAIRCDTATDLSKVENEAAIPYIPADGVILAETVVTYTPGESVFDVLKRVTREKEVQMEFREDALYSGAYVEGIHYLYEYDCGPLSGWMYQVNGQFPNYGCDQDQVQDGDAIVWLYTCDLGRDVGDNSAW